MTKYLGHHHAVAAIELSQDESGVYRTKTAWTLREKKLDKKKLLYVRSEPLQTGPVRPGSADKSPTTGEGLSRPLNAKE